MAIRSSSPPPRSPPIRSCSGPSPTTRARTSRRSAWSAWCRWCWSCRPSSPANTLAELDGARARQSRQAGLRHGRQRQRQPPHRRAVQPPRRRQGDARALSRRRAGDDRPHRRARVLRVRHTADGVAVHRRGTVARAGDHRQEPQPGAAAGADGRRVRAAGLRALCLARAARAGRHSGAGPRRSSARAAAATLRHPETAERLRSHRPRDQGRHAAGHGARISSASSTAGRTSPAT